jgi:protein ImuB
MELDGGATHERTVKPALPVADRALLLRLLHLDLVAYPPGAGVMTLRLAAVAGGRSKVQIGLFSPQMPEPMRLEVTLARIASLVGEGRAGRPVLLDSHRAESFRVDRFTVPGAMRMKEVVSAEESGEARCPVALRRMRPPVPVRMQGDAREVQAFYMQGTRYVVRERFGPWRRSGTWWSGEVWSREEWDVAAEASDGPGSMVCVLAHDLLRGRWQMEAIYD